MLSPYYSRRDLTIIWIFNQYIDTFNIFNNFNISWYNYNMFYDPILELQFSQIFYLYVLAKKKIYIGHCTLRMERNRPLRDCNVFMKFHFSIISMDIFNSQYIGILKLRGGLKSLKEITFASFIILSTTLVNMFTCQFTFEIWKCSKY